MSDFKLGDRVAWPNGDPSERLRPMLGTVVDFEPRGKLKVYDESRGAFYYPLARRVTKVEEA